MGRSSFCLKPYFRILDSCFGDAQYVSYYALEDFNESSNSQNYPSKPPWNVQGPLLISSRPCNWLLLLGPCRASWMKPIPCSKSQLEIVVYGYFLTLHLEYMHICVPIIAVPYL